MGAEIAASAAPELGVRALCFAAFWLGALLSAIALSADAGGFAHAAGGGGGGKSLPRFGWVRFCRQSLCRRTPAVSPMRLAERLRENSRRHFCSHSPHRAWPPA